MRKHINELLSLIKPINYTKEERNISDKSVVFFAVASVIYFPRNIFLSSIKIEEKEETQARMKWKKKNFSLYFFYDINNNSLWWDNKSRNVSSACWGMMKSRKGKSKITFEGNKLWLTTLYILMNATQFSLHLAHLKGISNYNEFVQAHSYDFNIKSVSSVNFLLFNSADNTNITTRKPHKSRTRKTPESICCFKPSGSKKWFELKGNILSWSGVIYDFYILFTP